MPDLRPYQLRAVDAVRRLIRDGSRAPLLVAPTGAGKTVIMAHVVASAIAKGRRVAVVAHRRELIRQIEEALIAAGQRPAIIAPWARPNPFAPVQIGSVQTMVRRELLPPADLLVIDEAHHTRLDNQWGEVVGMLRPRHVLGLTATPIRTDGQGLGVAAGGLYDAMEVVTSTAELVEQGYLARPVVYAPAVTPDLAGLRVERGDYSKGQAAQAMGTAAIVGDAVAHYQRLCPGARAAAFAVSLEHARTVADAFLAAGIPAEVIDGGLGLWERDMMLQRFRAGTTLVLVSCDLIGEGFDLPAIEAAILLRPTISTALYLQQVGRALRPAPCKARAVILDHAGNTLRHGLPTDDREWSLMGEDEAARAARRKPDPNAAPVWQCLECYGYSPRAADTCEACKAPRPYAGREVEVQAGELVEVQPYRFKTMTSAELLAKEFKDPEKSKARTLEALERIEKERGYKAGWARHVFAARQRKAGG